MGWGEIITVASVLATALGAILVTAWRAGSSLSSIQSDLHHVRETIDKMNRHSQAHAERLDDHAVKIGVHDERLNEHGRRIGKIEGRE